MEIQKHFVAYIDILGFANYVKDNQQNPEKPLELLQKFIDIAKKLNADNTNNTYRITAFSDNIVISVLPQDCFGPDINLWWFVEYMNTVQLLMISEIGILPIRGGITFGDLYHNESEILFGDALVEAYNMEHQHAFYPRILVNPKYIEPIKYMKSTMKWGYFRSEKKHPNFNAEQVKRVVTVALDYDGVLYCNYLSSLWERREREWATHSHDTLNKHKLFVESRIQRKPDLNTLRKYTWMKSYHNWFCEPFEEFHKYIIQDR